MEHTKLTGNALNKVVEDYFNIKNSEIKTFYYA